MDERKEGDWKGQEEEEAVDQSAGSAQSWLMLPMILGARPPSLPLWIKPLIELLQQTRDFARLNLDLA